ncbi:MAG: D-aminoacylase [Chitinophagaceae bacterium]|nr:D-aminoacylase [Chitinophagaceae bacterium]
MRIHYRNLVLFLGSFLLMLASCSTRESYDTIIRNGMVYDGLGGEAVRADVGIRGDSIAFIGDLSSAKARQDVDAQGMAVAPGFINMLSWATETLIEDGRSQSDIRQGVTLEVMGEGWSMGPLSEKMKLQEEANQGDIKYKISWNTLGEYLQFLEQKGISCNVASFVGAATVREYVIGEDNRAPTPAEMDSMKALVRQAMREGALGVGSSLIYPPAFFAKTEELIELCKVAAEYGGSYISHMRNEGNQLHEALEELIRIAREANVPAEIYHIKAGGKDNWNKMDSVIRRIEKARQEGLAITADMYPYIAGATGLTASLPPTLQDGGFGKLRERLQDPATRVQMKKAMQSRQEGYENFYYGSGGASNVLLLGFKQDSLKKYTGKRLAEVAAIRGKGPEETAMDLIVQDSSRIEVAYFMMSEENVSKLVPVPWISFGSDEGSYATEGVFLKSSTHPRAYGTFARLLGKYVREEKRLSLSEAIRKITSLPASNLKLDRRGLLKPGYYADVVVFNPDTIRDVATFEKPHQYALGVQHVWVNGVQVLDKGEHTGAKPGRAVRRNTRVE